MGEESLYIDVKKKIGTEGGTANSVGRILADVWPAQLRTGCDANIVDEGISAAQVTFAIEEAKIEVLKTSSVKETS